MRYFLPVGILLWAYLLIAVPALFAQSTDQKGKIFEYGNKVLDPNEDGYVSITDQGFSDDGYDPDEFEIKMFGIPIFGDGEVIKDNSNGKKCGSTDFIQDEKGYSMYAAYDNNNNLIFRMRIGENKPSILSYSILIDSDNLVGSDDPNSNSINPGFEIAITFIRKFGVFIYGIDGRGNWPFPSKWYSASTHSQVSTSSMESCNNNDYFIDYYVPLEDLTTLFGIDENTTLRFVGLSVTARGVITGTVADIGGVDDTDYNGCFKCAMLDLVENQCPSSISNLCETCAGFLEGATETPAINLPVLVGDTQIAGTSEIDASIFINIFSNTGVLLQDISTQSDSDGMWSSGLLNNGLDFEDSITVNALLPGKCASGLNDAGLSFAIVSPNQAPTVTGSSITITYIENNPPLIIDDEILITDDNTTLSSASITITENLEGGNDLLGIIPPPGITVQYLLSEGKILLDGIADIDTYITAFRSVTFQNISENPDQSIRVIAFQVFDGLNFSLPFTKNLLITEVNDPPIIIVNGNPADTLYYETNEDTPIQICLDVSDIDSNIILVTDAAIVENIGEVNIVGTTCIEFIPEPNFNGIIHIEVELCDNGTPSLCDSAVLVVDVLPVNDPPVVEINNVPTEILEFSTLKNTPFDFCIEATDVENDIITYLSSTFLVDNGSSLNLISDLCLSFNPGNNYVGTETIEVTICDNGLPNQCTTFTIIIEVLLTNDAPVIAEDSLFYTINKNTPLDLCINAVDPDNDPVSISEVNNLFFSSSNSITSELCLNYAPTLDFTGIEVLEVIICDNVFPPLCDTVFVKINVINVNNPPGLIVGGFQVDTILYETKINTPIDFCLPFEDPDNDPINITALSNITMIGTVSLTNDLCLNYVPGLNQTGMVWLEVTACDDSNPTGCVKGTIGINVLPVNTPPVIISDGASVDTLYFETLNNETLLICLETLDIDGDVVDIDGIDEIEGGGFYLPDQDQLCIIFIPDEGFTGTDIHIVTVCDNGNPIGCDQVVIVIDVVPFNHPPSVLSNGIEADTIIFRTPALTSLAICVEAIDQDGDFVEIKSFDFTPKSATTSLTINESLCFNYTPGNDFLGTDWITTTVCDDRNPELCDGVVIGIEVYSVNTAPRITFNGNAVDSILVNGFEEVPMLFTFGVTDGENDNLTVSDSRILNGSGDLEIELKESIQISYTPASKSAGRHRLSFGVCDNGLPALCDSVIVAINVERINKAPIAINDTIQSIEGEVVNVNILSNDSDPDDDDIFVIIESLIPSTNGEISITEDGEFTFVPSPDYSGKIMINYTISDVAKDSKTASADIFIEIDPIDKTIFAFEALSPNGDGLNDFWVIQNIKFYPNNTVLIFDRWNNRVFEISGYNNTSVKWAGESNIGLSKKNVNEGTYYYLINLGDGTPSSSGMIVLKR